MNSNIDIDVQKVFTCVLFLTIKMNWNFVLGEWIELPQFSNKFKVYRLSELKDDSIIIDPKLAIRSSISITPEHLNEVKKIVETQYPVKKNVNSLFKKRVISANISDVSLQDFPTSSMPLISFNSSNTSDSMFSKFVTEKYSDLLYTNHSSKMEISFNSTLSRNNIKKILYQQTSMEKFPFQLLNIVHKILLSNHAKTLEVKYQYLNSLRVHLLKNIASVFSSKIIHGMMRESNRNKRSYYNEDHEQHIGFPSLEGALLAISFLTFSVYLIQLVMMLLRNIAGNPTSLGTVLANRNKRYVNELQDSAKICDYIYESTISTP